MPPNEPEITFVEGAPYVYIERSIDREHYRPRYRRKKQLLEVWHRVVRKNPLAVFDWLITRGWEMRKDALGEWKR